jgi:hypothetical protein
MVLSHHAETVPPAAGSIRTSKNKLAATTRKAVGRIMLV